MGPPAPPPPRLWRFGPPPKWQRPPRAPLIREGGGRRWGRPAPSAATRPPDSGGSADGEASAPWSGHSRKGTCHGALETEAGIGSIAAAFKLRLVFPPGRRVLVLPEVARGPRQPRPRRLLLVVRRQLTAGGEESVGGACGSRDRRARRDSGQRRWGRAGRARGLGPFGAGQAGPRGARRAGIKSTQGRLRQLDPEGEQLFPGGGGRAKGRRDVPCRPGRPPPPAVGVPPRSIGGQR